MNDLIHHEGHLLRYAAEYGTEAFCAALTDGREAFTEHARIVYDLISEIEGRKGAGSYDAVMRGIENHSNKSELEPLRNAISHGIATKDTILESLECVRASYVQRVEGSIGRKLAEGIIDRTEAVERLQSLSESSHPREPKVRFHTPSEIESYQPAQNEFLVGDCHIMRGAVFVIGGQPGIGKSTAATELAVSGALGRDWLGLKVHTPFKTMIIQNENGRYRLKTEYVSRELGNSVDSMILVSEPPPFGLSFGDSEFRSDLQSVIKSFKPDLVIIDPWNAAAKDDTQRDYRETFDAIRSILPKGADKPALGIVAHTRKPKSDEKRTGGSAMMHLLAGSHILSSVPRSVFIMVPADDKDETDNRVVWFNPKNNNGATAGRTAWERNPKGFSPAEEFDWNEFDEPSTGRKIIEEGHFEEALSGGAYEKSTSVKKLMKVSGCGVRACQKALSPDGKFSHLFTIEEDKWIRLKP